VHNARRVSLANSCHIAAGPASAPTRPARVRLLLWRSLIVRRRQVRLRAAPLIQRKLQTLTSFTGGLLGAFDSDKLQKADREHALRRQTVGLRFHPERQNDPGGWKALQDPIIHAAKVWAAG
jgi:hypothetical protein